MLDILLVEDTKTVRNAMTALLQRNSYKVMQCSNGQKAVDKMRSTIFDLIITDLKMVPIDGFTVLREAQKLQPEAEVIVITGVGSIEDGVKAMKMGAFDFLQKPVSNERLLRLAKHIEEKRDLEKEFSSLREELQAKNDFEAIVGKSKSMLNVLNLVSQVSQTDTTVLISGESGTGKELVARAVHTNSRRRNNQMVAVNCGALPEALQESELFGHVKGSFTGAFRDKKGLFEEADNGTLFLDEIAEMSLSAQVKLLRFLQDGEIRRVGDNRPIKADVRLIASTNKDLEEEIAANTFREDLFYRLHVIPIYLPPLREHRDDIPLLVDHFLNKYSMKLDKDSKTVSNKAMRILQNYDWPGNVRELENAIERAIVLTNGAEILPTALPDRIIRRQRTPSSSEIFTGMTLAEVEKRHIIRTMQDCDNQVRKASFGLGITESVLMSKLKKYNIDQPQVSETSYIAPERMTENDEIKNSLEGKKDHSAQPGISTILVDLGLTLSQLEKRYILKMLARTKGNRKKTAEYLGISPVTLWRKLKELGIANGRYLNDKKVDRLKEGILLASSEQDKTDSSVSDFLEAAIEQGFTLSEIEQKHLLNTLQASKGRKKETAFRLGISKATLWRKLKTVQPQELYE